MPAQISEDCFLASCLVSQQTKDLSYCNYSFADGNEGSETMNLMNKSAAILGLKPRSPLSRPQYSIRTQKALENGHLDLNSNLLLLFTFGDSPRFILGEDVFF